MHSPNSQFTSKGRFQDFWQRSKERENVSVICKYGLTLLYVSVRSSVAAAPKLCRQSWVQCMGYTMCAILWQHCMFYSIHLGSEPSCQSLTRGSSPPYTIITTYIATTFSRPFLLAVSYSQTIANYCRLLHTIADDYKLLLRHFKNFMLAVSYCEVKMYWLQKCRAKFQRSQRKHLRKNLAPLSRISSRVLLTEKLTSLKHVTFFLFARNKAENQIRFCPLLAQ